MSNTVTITNLTPGKIAFEYQGTSHLMGGEASYDPDRSSPDYLAFTSSVWKAQEPGVQVRLSRDELEVITKGLREEMASRGMTIEFLP